MSGQFWLGFVTPFLLAGTGWLAWKVFEFLSRFGDDSVRCVYCQRTLHESMVGHNIRKVLCWELHAASPHHLANAKRWKAGWRPESPAEPWPPADWRNQALDGIGDVLDSHQGPARSGPGTDIGAGRGPHPTKVETTANEEAPR